MPDQPRFQFVTQLPRDDGCGVFVLQMLAGRPYGEIANMIAWGERTNHYTTWKDLVGVLTALGVIVGAPIPVTRWSEIDGVAIVHVAPDHFVLYDAERGAFYDPGMPAGPQADSQHVPRSYLPVSLTGV